MTTLFRTFASAIIDTIIFFIILLVFITAFAPKSNGLFSLSAFGVGLLVSLPASIFVALPSGIIMGLLSTKLVHQTSLMIAMSALVAIAVILIWSILFLFDTSDSSLFFGSRPFFAMMFISFM